MCYRSRIAVQSHFPVGIFFRFSFFIIYLLLILFDRRMNWGEFYSVDQGRPQ